MIILSDDQFVAIILYKTTPYVKYIGLIIWLIYQYFAFNFLKSFNIFDSLKSIFSVNKFSKSICSPNSSLKKSMKWCQDKTKGHFKTLNPFSQPNFTTTYTSTWCFCHHQHRWIQLEWSFLLFNELFVAHRATGFLLIAL